VGTFHDQRIGQMDESPRPGEKDAGCDRREDPIWQHLSTAAEVDLSSLACVPHEKTAAQGLVK
jgi:hypothetical protein